MLPRRFPLLLACIAFTLLSCQLSSLLTISREESSATSPNIEVELIKEALEGKPVKPRIETEPTPTIESFTVNPDLPELSTSLVCPSGMAPGEIFGESLVVIVTNRGQPASEFSVDLVLSTDTDVPIASAYASDTFSEDMLLSGGRETLTRLGSGVSHRISRLPFDFGLPADVPEGNYYLAAVADSDNFVVESDESNNVTLCPLQVCPALAGMASMTLDVFSGFSNGPAEMELAWSFDEGVLPQELRITIFRWDEGVWKNVMPDQEPMEVNAIELNGQAVVGVLGAKSGKYQIVFDSSNDCKQKSKFAFELTIP